MEDNYASWNVDHKEFYTLRDGEDKLRFLVRFALLAPSSHNSQPWRFRVRGDKVIIYPEESRALPRSDHNYRQLFISLGVALKNLLTAADFYNYYPEVGYFPEDLPGAAIVVSLQAARNISYRDESIIRSLVSRHTNRNKYIDKRVSDHFLNKIKSFSDDSLRVYVVSDKRRKDRIAGIVSDALIEAMDDSEFRSELSEYVKNNKTHAKLGMPMFGFGMPTPLSFLAPFLLKYFNVNRLSRKQDEALLTDHTPYYVIINTAEDDAKSWVRAGQVFGAIALLAEIQDISIAPMAAAIQIGDNYKRLQEEMTTEMRPQIFFRMGYAKETMPHSPRLSLEEVLEKND